MAPHSEILCVCVCHQNASVYIQFCALAFFCTTHINWDCLLILNTQSMNFKHELCFTNEYSRLRCQSNFICSCIPGWVTGERLSRSVPVSLLGYAQGQTLQGKRKASLVSEAGITVGCKSQLERPQI